MSKSKSARSGTKSVVIQSVAPPQSRKRNFAAATLAMGEAQNDLVTQAKAEPATKPKKPKARTREGKKGLVLYLEPVMLLELRTLAARHGTDVQSLGLEALGLLFARYKRRAQKGTRHAASAASKPAATGA